MTTPLLTVGMATYEDYAGVYFTIQHMRQTNDCRDVEFLVIDNKPDSPVSRHLRNFLGQCQHGTAGARYVPMAKPVGTSAPRNCVFSEAAGTYVLCVDSHVLTQTYALQRLLQYYDETGSRDLLSGPLLYDNLKTISTHFNYEWRGGMWGTWGATWQCRCKRMNRIGDGQLLVFSVLNSNERAAWVDLPLNKPVYECPKCKHGLPEGVPYNGHEDRLRQLGYTELGLSDKDPAFEVPGNGLGLFSCRKDNWLKFNEHFQGFGGEELYIHEKYRQAGYRVMCLPFLKWVHRFYRRNQHYPLRIYDKVRNYVIGYIELGRDLQPVYDHFVASGLFSPDQWEYLVYDPVSHKEWVQ